MDNYTTLQRNTLEGFSPVAGLVYMRLYDKYEGHKSKSNEAKALLQADFFEQFCGNTLHKILHEYPWDEINISTICDLEEFLALRYVHNFAGKEKEQIEKAIQSLIGELI